MRYWISLFSLQKNSSLAVLFDSTFTLNLGERIFSLNWPNEHKFRFSIPIISNWFCLRLRTATTNGTWPTAGVLISASNCFSKLNNVEQFASHRETVVHIKSVHRHVGYGGPERWKIGLNWKHIIYLAGEAWGDRGQLPACGTRRWKHSRRWEAVFQSVDFNEELRSHLPASSGKLD